MAPEISSPKETFAAYIQIPGPVFYNKNFSEKTKLLYGLLAAMTQAPRYYAFAKNSTLLRYIGGSERTLQRCLNELEAAGELTIENGTGGRTLRKIRLTRLQPSYPDNHDGVNPDSGDGGNKNNRERKNRGGKAPAVSQDDIIQWFNTWVIKLELDEKDALDLMTDLHDFAENRASVGKPLRTIKAAARMGNRLKTLSEASEYPVAMMRYLLNKSIINGWSDVFELKDSDMEDFGRFLASEYGIRTGGAGANASDYF